MTNRTEKDDDAMKLADLARGLPHTDLDPAAAERIVAVARRDVGHGPPKRRVIEAAVVAMLVTRDARLGRLEDLRDARALIRAVLR